MSYKVNYFNSRGKAELIRMLLVAAEQKFEDVRIEKDKWPEIKATTPTGVLPFVETPDGKILVQSGAIARLLAKKFNFYGKNDDDYFNIERALAQLDDIFSELIKVFFAPDDKKEAVTKDFVEGKGKNLIKNLAKFIEEGKSGFFAGDSPTIADLALICSIEYLRFAGATLLQDNPEIEKHYTRTVEAMPLIKKWIADRPVTQF